MRSGVANLLVDSVHELKDGVLAELVAGIFDGAERRTANDGGIVAVKVVRVEELPNLKLDELQKLLVVHFIALVQKDDDVGNADLLGEEDVLACLGHGPVDGRHDEDGAVHLRSARDHVFDVVCMAGAVYVRVVPRGSLVLDVGRVDGNAPRLFLGSLVDFLVRRKRGGRLLHVGEHLGDRRRQSRLAVIDVSNRADVQVGLAAVKRRRKSARRRKAERRRENQQRAGAHRAHAKNRRSRCHDNTLSYVL